MGKVIVDSDDDCEPIVQGEHEIVAADGFDVSPAAQYSAGKDATPMADAALTARSTSSSEKLRHEIHKAHSAMVEPTPSRKRRAVDDLGVENSRTSRRSSLKRARTAGPLENGAIGIKQDEEAFPTTFEKRSHVADPVQRHKWEDRGVSSSDKDKNSSDKMMNSTNTSATSSYKVGAEATNATGASHQRKATKADHSAKGQLNGNVRNDMASHSPTPFPHAPSGESQFTASGTGFESHNPNVLFSGLSSLITNVSSGEDRDPELHIREGDGDGSTNNPIRIDLDEQSISYSMKNSGRASDAGGPMVVLPSKGFSSSQRTGAKVTKHVDASEGSEDELNSDERVALPKERYKPRPSRSRSSGDPQRRGSYVAVEETEAVKSKLKGPKSENGISANNSNILRDMGFSLSQAENALVEADGNIQQAVELLTADGSASHEANQYDTTNALSLTSEEDSAEKKKRKGRKSSRRARDEENQGASRVNTVHADEGDDRYAFREDHSKASGKREDSPGDTITVCIEPRKAKRARGRPKKSTPLGDDDGVFDPHKLEEQRTKTKYSTAQEEEHAEVADAGNEGDLLVSTRGEREREALRQIEANEQDSDTAQANKPEADATKLPEDHRQPSIKGTVSNGSHDDRQSSASQGRVPLKVGLSRRARIEPLLRMIKK